MAGLSALKHWMLHTDTRASEYETILKLSPGYDPVRAIDPALTFYAPLSTGIDSVPGNIRGTFTRNSGGTHWAPRGAFLLEAAEDVARHEYTRDDQALGVLMEPASTNKCTNFNANPDAALTNMSVIGDAAGILTRVYDPELIEESGLSHICTSGYVFQMDNTAGSTVSYALVQGEAGVLALHTANAFGVATVGNCYVRIGGVADSPAFPVGGSMQRRTISGTTVNVANKLSIGCDAGGICRFVLNNYEEQPVATNPIVTEGAATTRAVDALNWPLAGRPYGKQSVANSEFTAWTDPTVPDEWRKVGTHNANNYVEQSESGVLRLVSDGAYVGIDQIALPSSEWAHYEVSCAEASDGSAVVTFGAGGQTVSIAATGKTSGLIALTGTDNNLIFTRLGGTGTVDMKFDYIRVREATSILNQTEGMAAFVFRPGFSSADIPNGLNSSWLLTLDDATSDAAHLAYYLKQEIPGGQRNELFRAYDGANVVSVLLAAPIVRNQEYLITTNWTGSALQISYKTLGTWKHATAGSYGGWSMGAALAILIQDSAISPGAHAPSDGSAAYLWSKNRGTAWLESFFSEVAN